jgi:hypothetical protein
VFGTLLILLALVGGANALPVLVAEYHFDDDAIDSTGNGNNGVINGATFVPGVSRQALSFDGTNDYIKIPDSTVNNMGAGTIAMWILPSETQDPGYSSFKLNGAFFGKQVNDVDSMAVIGFDDTTLPARISFRLANSGGTLVGNVKVSPDVWHYIVVNWNGSYWNIYVDGILDVGQAKTTTLPNYPSATLTSIGAWGGDGNSYFNGNIDEVRIYNDALSATEVKAEYDKPNSPSQIPEFPTIVLPIAGVIGLMFLFQRRGK